MAKNGKTTLEKLEGLVSIVARNVAKIQSNMVTKDDLKTGLNDVERRLSVKIDAIEEKVDNLEIVDVLNLQGRVSVLEKDVKQIKHKNV